MVLSVALKPRPVPGCMFSWAFWFKTMYSWLQPKLVENQNHLHKMGIVKTIYPNTASDCPQCHFLIHNSQSGRAALRCHELFWQLSTRKDIMYGDDDTNWLKGIRVLSSSPWPYMHRLWRQKQPGTLTYIVRSSEVFTLKASPWSNPGRRGSGTCSVLYSFRGNNHKIGLFLWLGYNGFTLCTVDWAGWSQTVVKQKRRETIMNSYTDVNFHNSSQRYLIHTTPTVMLTIRTNVCWTNERNVEGIRERSLVLGISLLLNVIYLFYILIMCMYLCLCMGVGYL